MDAGGSTARASGQRRGILTGRLDGPSFGECVGHLERLRELRGAPVATHRGDLVGSLTLFLGALARALSPTLPSATHPVVLDAMRMMEERPAYPWTLTEIAHALHVAPGYLVRLFKAATGLPPMAYLSRQRIELAAARLLHTELFRATFPVALRAQRVHLPGAFHPRGPTVSDPVTAVLPEDPPTPIWYAPRAVAQPPREVS